MQASRSHEKLRAELYRIDALRCQWNSFSVAERVLIARASPDLSLFFRRHIGATAQIIDLFEAKRCCIGEMRPKAGTRVAALRIIEDGDVK